MANFCPNCGSPVGPNQSFCQKCGTNLKSFSGNEPAAPVSAANAPEFSSDDITLEDIPAYPDTPSYPDRPVFGQMPVIPTVALGLPRDLPAATYQPSYAGPMQNGPSYSAPSAPASKPAAKAREKKSRLPMLIGIAGTAVLLLYAAPKVLHIVNPVLIETEEDSPTVQSVTPPAETPVSETVPTEPVTSGTEQGIADFLRYNIPCDCVLNEDYQYPGMSDDGSQSTVYGTLTFLQYDSVPVSNEILSYGEQNGMDLSGYELRTLKSQIDFSNDAIGENGVKVRRFFTDYYDISEVDESHEQLTDNYGDSYYRFRINVNGEMKYAYLFADGEWSELEGYQEFTDTTNLLVPAGYDGVVRGFVSPTIDDLTIDNSPDKIFLFRMR